MSDEYNNEVQRKLEKVVPKSDIIICSVLIPGKCTPKLITERMVRKMNKGSVIIDLSAESGGNCEMTLYVSH
jgi:NAD/NADP transhydrogenase alpha subunit